MEIAKFQHACFTVKTGSSTLVVDPGEYTKDIIVPRDVAAVIITHEHADHCSYELTKRILKKSPKATIIGHPQTIAQFSNFQTTPVQPGDQLEIAGVNLRFFGGNHAPITSTVQTPPNIGVLINNSLYYAGDSFTNPGVPVDILALPVSAPWLRIDESIRFLNEINPQLAFPTHDAILSREGKELVDRLVSGDTPARCRYTRIDGQKLRIKT